MGIVKGGILRHYNKKSIMNKNTLDELLIEIQKFNENEKEIIKSNEKRGENFNIFSVLNVQSKEVKLHSSLIAELLNVKGSHGLGSIFLEKFLETIDDDWTKEIDIKNSKTQAELYIGQLTYDGHFSEGGRIDIILESPTSVLVIENKIYASDQEYQLTRYKNYCISRNKFFRILYLTLDGAQPNNYTRGNLNDDDNLFVSISYKQHILNWLNQCAILAFDRPMVRETIKQYINTVKKLTNMDFDFEKAEILFEYLDTPDRIESIVKINKLKNAFNAYIVRKYLKNSLNEIADKYELDLYIDDALVNFVGKPTYFYFVHKRWDKMAICFSTESANWTNFYVAIGYQKGFDFKNENKKFKLNCFNDNPTISCPYGWEHLNDEYKNWNDDFILKIKNGEFTSYIDDWVFKILSEIKSNNKVEINGAYGIGGNRNDYLNLGELK